MGEKVVFDPDNLLIIVNNGVTSLDAEIDLYSAAKREWKDDPVLNKLKLPFRTIAGDPIPGGKVYGAAFFLQNQAGWRIRPHEADHELIIVGNLFPEDELLPMIVPTLGEYTVTVSMERSSLTQVVMTGSGVTQQDKLDIAEKVWVHTKGEQVSGDISNIYKVEKGRWRLDKDACQMIFYGEEDGGRSPDPLLVFDLKDEHGNPSVERIFERVPVLT